MGPDKRMIKSTCKSCHGGCGVIATVENGRLIHLGRLYCDYHGWGGKYPKTQLSWGKQLEITNADGEMAVWFLNSLDKVEYLILIDRPQGYPSGRQS